MGGRGEIAGTWVDKDMDSSAKAATVDLVSETAVSRMRTGIRRRLGLSACLPITWSMLLGGECYC